MCAFNPAVIMRVKLANHKEEVELKQHLAHLESVHVGNMDQINQDYVEVIQELRSMKYQEIQDAICNRLGQKEKDAQKDMLKRQNEFFKVKGRKKSKQRSRGLCKVSSKGDLCGQRSSPANSQQDKVTSETTSSPDVISLTLNTEYDRKKKKSAAFFPKIITAPLRNISSKATRHHNQTNVMMKCETRYALLPPLTCTKCQKTQKS